jgi:hypothetical protein
LQIVVEFENIFLQTLVSARRAKNNLKIGVVSPLKWGGLMSHPQT